MTELYQKLYEYSQLNMAPFHMPGHKRKACFEEAGLLSDIFKIDITEIDGFDDLHHCTGILKDAQDRAAKLYHSDKSYFMINGSTGGILAGISAITEHNKKIIVARNSHKSVYNAIFLCGLEPVYIWPDVYDEYDVAKPITAKDVEAIISENTDAAGIIITSPTYEGFVSELREIAHIAHKYHMPLLVDEAHGAHFPLSEKMPVSALEAGADIVIHSTHKTLPAMTQTALLHIQGDIVERDIIEKYLSIYQTSSPSYVLMASIDSCISHMQEHAQEELEHLCFLRNHFEKSCEKLKYIKIIKQSAIQDPGKLIISVKHTSMNGVMLGDVLLNKYQLQMEMCASTYVIAIMTAFDTLEDIDRLSEALMEIDHNISEKQCAIERNVWERPLITQPISAAWKADAEWIPLAEAEEKISASLVYVYPPGIPIIAPGEKISSEILHSIQNAVSSELNVIGLSGNHDAIKVLLN